MGHGCGARCSPLPRWPEDCLNLALQRTPLDPSPDTLHGPQFEWFQGKSRPKPQRTTGVALQQGSFLPPADSGLPPPPFVLTEACTLFPHFGYFLEPSFLRFQSNDNVVCSFVQAAGRVRYIVMSEGVHLAYACHMCSVLRAAR